MSRVRPPAVAGRFYPESPELLREQVAAFIEDGVGHAQSTPKALIAPHAGYVYSGPVAGSAFATLATSPATPTRVVLIGPAHTVAIDGLAVPTVDAFRTPLGDVPLDLSSIESLSRLPDVVRSDRPHHTEHALEVELPFLQETLEDFSIVPVVVGWVEPSLVTRVLSELWGGPETLIVVSSDLSHYLTYGQAQAVDRETARAIVALKPDRIQPDQACGQIPICALLQVAEREGLTAELLDLRSSGDTAGDPDRVVGYGAFSLG